jgi:hypothetical protein
MIHNIVLLQIKTQTGLSETINQRTGNAIPGRKKDIGKKSLMQKEFENNTGVIKIRKAKMDRQHYGQQLKDKITNNDLQNAAQKTKDRATRTPLKFGCVYCICNSTTSAALGSRKSLHCQST